MQKRKTILASPINQLMNNLLLWMDSISPHTSPFPTQISALGPWNDRTAVRHLCPPYVFQVHFPTSFPAQPPLSLKKVKGS